MENVLNFISEWFKNECDGEWERESQIKIETTSNPGWSIKIDLKNTNLESLTFEMDTIENTENDWYFYEFRSGVFHAAGDLSKLEFLLTKFRDYINGSLSN